MSVAVSGTIFGSHRMEIPFVRLKGRGVIVDGEHAFEFATEFRVDESECHATRAAEEIN